MLSVMDKLKARKVQMNFTIAPDLFDKLSKYVETAHGSSRSAVINLLIKLLVSEPFEAGTLDLDREEMAMLEKLGGNVAAVLRKVGGQ